MYERKSQQPIARGAFAARLVRHLVAAGILVSGSLSVRWYLSSPPPSS
jgi:hypothetical protein